MYSLVIPVYKNEASLPDLLKALTQLDVDLDGRLDVVFVVDGSPDGSAALLEAALRETTFASQLVLLSRNFGSFAAIRAGLGEAAGPYFAVMAADLQEPPELVSEFFRALESEPIDVAIGSRIERDDPLLSRWSARIFWSLYRRFVQREMPPGGVDVFGCNLTVRDRLLSLAESNSSLVGLLFWMGFRRKLIPYTRRAREFGESAWTLSDKLRYFSNSVFAFSDLPIRILIGIGALGLIVSTTFGGLVIAARIFGFIEVPGYAAIIITTVFFAALNMLGLGVIGSYVWRAFENTKHRPDAIIMSCRRFDGTRR
jgi:glycosyltransferase involved in cell wall biosynthesis